MAFISDLSSSSEIPNGFYRSNFIYSPLQCIFANLKEYHYIFTTTKFIIIWSHFLENLSNKRVVFYCTSQNLPIQVDWNKLVFVYVMLRQGQFPVIAPDYQKSVTTRISAKESLHGS